MIETGDTGPALEGERCNGLAGWDLPPPPSIDRSLWLRPAPDRGFFLGVFWAFVLTIAAALAVSLAVLGFGSLLRPAHAAEMAKPISLWVNACIDGTLRGQPKTLCREFQVRGFTTADACRRARHISADEWFKEAIETMGIPARVTGMRCGPSSPEEVDP